MREIKALEKLREYVRTPALGLWKKDFDRIADEIQAEVDSRFMEPPVDADGVPIRPGDVVSSDISKNKTVWMVSSNSFFVYGDFTGYNPLAFRHVKQRTLEDILEELVECATFPGESLDRGDIEGFAAEIRELLGGDAE